MSSIIDHAKEVSKGQEKSILISVANADPEWFDGVGRPCPKCGGTDRFSWRESTQSFICRKCFAEGSHPDVVGNAAWLIGTDDLSAAKSILRNQGIDPDNKPKKSKVQKSWAQMKDKTYVLSTAIQWSADNPPIVESVMRGAGAIGKIYNGISAFAFPIYGPKNKRQPMSKQNSEIIGATLYHILDGFKMEVWNPKTKSYDCQRSVTINKYQDSGVGIIGPWEKILDPKTHTVIKCEGTTDMLAANSVLRDVEGYVAVSNSCGAVATPPKWFAKLLEGKKVFVIHDNDEAGKKGTKKWLTALVPGSRVSVPEFLQPGMDLRDYLQTHSANEFLAFLKNQSADLEAPEVIPPSVAGPGTEESPADGDPDDTAAEKILSDLTLDVLYENEKGDISVYCYSTRKSRVITSLSRMQPVDFEQLIGDRAVQMISNDPEMGQYHVNQVKTAIALTAANLPVANDIEKRGRGIWQSSSGKIVLCNGRHLSVWHEGSLSMHMSPRHEDSLYELTSVDWFSHEEMEHLCVQAMDVEFRREAFRRLEKWLEQWTWSTVTAPNLVASLVAATMMQAIWPWRPMVSVTGSSNTGKSTLLNFLASEDQECIFGKAMSFRTNDTTKAGITQGVGANLPIICIDEWDSHKQRDREAILTAFRGATGGGTSKRGSSVHKGVEQRLRHISWISGIYNNIERDADKNRFIQLELKKPSKARWNQFNTPPVDVAFDIGKKLFASMVVVAKRALELQLIIERVDIADYDKRILRNLSVPAAAVGALMGYSETQTEERFKEFAHSFDNDESADVVPLHDEILGNLLSLQVPIGHGQTRAFADLISNPTQRKNYKSEIEAIGASITEDGLFVAAIHRSLRVPFSCDMKDSAINRSLLSVEGSQKVRKRINGTRPHGTLIPIDYIIEKFGVEFFDENGKDGF